jgi:uncharacterized protein involved in exopolysaccharide biosynthesis
VELIAVFRLLWRRRRLVVLGAILAVGAAFVLGPSPTPPRGFAATRVLLDTSRSQLAADAPFGADTLAWRATLSAQMLGTEDNRRTIAAAAGISPANLDITDLELTIPTIPASLPKAAVQGAYSSAKPFALDLHRDDIVPIISISGSAPDRASAVRLVEATVAALESYTSVPANAERLALELRTVAPIDSVAIPGGQGRKRMAAIAMVLVCMWIAGVALMPMALGGLRRAFQDAETVRA